MRKLQSENSFTPEAVPSLSKIQIFVAPIDVCEEPSPEDVPSLDKSQLDIPQAADLGNKCAAPSSAVLSAVVEPRVADNCNGMVVSSPAVLTPEVDPRAAFVREKALTPEVISSSTESAPQAVDVPGDIVVPAPTAVPASTKSRIVVPHAANVCDETPVASSVDCMPVDAFGNYTGRNDAWDQAIHDVFDYIHHRTIQPPATKFRIVPGIGPNKLSPPSLYFEGELCEWIRSNCVKRNFLSRRQAY